MQPNLTPPPSHSTMSVQAIRRCLHSRLVDDVRTPDGKKTGRLLCLECLTEFPDPDYQVSRQ